MRELHKLGNYDRDQLKKARDLIEKVHTYHYGDSYMKSEINRLETIIEKIDYLISKTEGGGITAHT